MLHGWTQNVSLPIMETQDTYMGSPNRDGWVHACFIVGDRARREHYKTPCHTSPYWCYLEPNKDQSKRRFTSQYAVSSPNKLRRATTMTMTRPRMASTVIYGCTTIHPFIRTKPRVERLQSHEHAFTIHRKDVRSSKFCECFERAVPAKIVSMRRSLS